MSTPVDIVKRLLANGTDEAVVRELFAPDGTYVSLCYENAALQRILPYAGAHPGGGPAALLHGFTTVARIWATEDFRIEAAFGGGGADADADAAVVDVAVFGRFTYRSRTLGKRVTSPFAAWCKVDVAGGRVTYLQFMEDTLGTAATFEVGGEKTYWVDNGADGGEEIKL